MKVIMKKKWQRYDKQNDLAQKKSIKIEID